MRLTTFTDYTLRVLIYLGANDARRATIGQIAAAYGISENHLMKVVHHLAQEGYIETTRGKGGGMRLARDPRSINVGEIVRGTETDQNLVECFDREASDCRIEAACALRGILGRAVESFYEALERHTLADLLTAKPRLQRLLARTDSRAGRV